MPIVKEEVIDDCKKRVVFEFDKEKVSSLADDIAREVSKNYTIKGFRKNTAPLDAVKLSARKHILDNLKQKLVSESFEDIVFELNIKPFGQPVLNDLKVSLTSFSADFTIGYMPDFELQQYKDFVIEKPTDLPQKEVVEDMMKEQVCEKFSSSAPFTPDDFLLNGDTAVINYSGTVDGKPFENSQAEGVIVNLGEGKSVPGFEDNLIGARPGETREFDVNFAEDFSVPDLAGKTVKFSVEVLSASRKTPATYDQSLAETLGLSSLDELDQEIEKQSQQRVDEIVFRRVQPEVLNKLLESNPVAVPAWQAVEIAKQIAVQHNLNWLSVEDNIKEKLLMDAQNKVKISYLFEKIKDTVPECVLSTEELLSILNANIGSFPENVQQELQKGTNMQLFSEIFADIQNQHILRWLVNNSTFVSKVQEQTSEVVQETVETQTSGE